MAKIAKTRTVRHRTSGEGAVWRQSASRRPTMLTVHSLHPEPHGGHTPASDELHLDSVVCATMSASLDRGQ